MEEYGEAFGEQGLRGLGVGIGGRGVDIKWRENGRGKYMEECGEVKRMQGRGVVGQESVRV